jgi:hypothetical protein
MIKSGVDDEEVVETSLDVVVKVVDDVELVTLVSLGQFPSASNFFHASYPHSISAGGPIGGSAHPSNGLILASHLPSMQHPTDLLPVNSSIITAQSLLEQQLKSQAV